MKWPKALIDAPHDVVQVGQAINLTGLRVALLSSQKVGQATNLQYKPQLRDLALGIWFKWTQLLDQCTTTYPNTHIDAHTLHGSSQDHTSTFDLRHFLSHKILLITTLIMKR